MKVTDANDVTIAEYRYNGLNRRIARMVRKVVQGNERWDRTDYYYSESWQVVEERFGLEQTDKDAVATAPRYQYVWDIRYIDAPVCRDENKNSDGDCIDAATGVQGSNTGDEHLYYCQDANFNVTALVDGYDGAVVERYLYDPYGKVSVRHGVRDAAGGSTTEWNERTSNTFANDILYCGYRFDPESGLYQVRFRYYHPTLGRWTSRDPIGYADGMHLVLYIANTPGNQTDPLGLASALPRDPITAMDPTTPFTFGPVISPRDFQAFTPCEIPTVTLSNGEQKQADAISGAFLDTENFTVVPVDERGVCVADNTPQAKAACQDKSSPTGSDGSKEGLNTCYKCCAKVNPKARIVAKWDPTQAWLRPGFGSNNRQALLDLVRHEWGHFKITQVVAVNYTAMLQGIQPTCLYTCFPKAGALVAVRAVEDKMDELYRNAVATAKWLNHAYDDATDHGGDPTKQKWWNDTFFK